MSASPTDAADPGRAPPASAPPSGAVFRRRLSEAGWSLLLLAPALFLLAALFAYPLVLSVMSAFTVDGAASLGNFGRVLEL